MKTKLIALLLVVVMAVSALAGCAYNYQKEDLTPYVTVDAAKLYAALQDLKIDDGDFTTDEATRQQKVLVHLAEELAALIEKDADRKKTEGPIADKDYVTYLYFRVATVDDSTAQDGSQMTNHYLDTSKMLSGNITKMLLDGQKDPSFQMTLRGALVGFDTANLCEVKTSGDLPATGYMLVEYSVSTSENSTLTKKSNVLLDLSNTADPLVKAILDRNADSTNVKIAIGTAFATGKAEDTSTDAIEKDDKLTTTNGTVTSTYESVKITSVITGTPVSTGADSQPLIEVPYLNNTDEEMKTISLTDMYGDKLNITKTTPFQWYIFPVSCYDIPDLDEGHKTDAVREVLFTVLGESIAVSSLELFKSTEYKYTKTEGESTKDVTLTSIIAQMVLDYKEISTKKSAVTTAEKAVETAKKAVEAAEKALADAAEADKAAKQEALDTANASLTTAKTALTDAEAALATSEQKVAADTILAELALCVKTTPATGTEPEKTETAIEAIYAAYMKGVYDELESAYNTEILEHVYAALGEVFGAAVTYTGSLPEKAVKEAYKRNMQAYKYQYYEGSESSSSGTTSTPYVDLYKNLDAFLCAKVAKELGGAEVQTKAEAEALIRKEAERQVKDQLAVYALADALSAKYADADLVLDKNAAHDYADLQAALYNQSILEYYETFIQFGYDVSSMFRSGDWYMQYYGETNLRTAYLADLIMAFATETEKSSDAEDFGGADARTFKNVKYTFNAPSDGTEND